MNKHDIIRLITVTLFALLCYSINAQDDAYARFKQQHENKFNAFKAQKDREFQEFRDRINRDYAAFLKKSWDEFEAFKGIKRPNNDRSIPPVIFNEKDNNKPIEDTPLPIEEVIPVPNPEPQPEPVVPILDEQEKGNHNTYIFETYGTKVNVRIPRSAKFKLKYCNGNEIAKVWETLSSPDYNCTVIDCIDLREKMNLCDYAYLTMLWDFSKAYFGRDCNEAVLFMSFIFCQSGYKMRIAIADNKVVMLFASKHHIYDYRYWALGDGFHYYAFNSDADKLLLCDHPFPQEKPLSLQVGSEQLYALMNSQSRVLQSKRYNDAKAAVSVNENLIQFYNNFPTSQIDDDFGTRWAIYANTPICQQAKSTLYPSLKSAIKGLSQLDAVNKLLNFVQTAFVYEFDDKVWGCDRAFFPDETLYYPYCDCEDRSILFSRLVRDLIGLESVLIYYPGHLATAVRFTEQVNGDYVSLNGKKYVICDPTFINAPVGRTMTGMDNGAAKVILLDKH